MSSQFKKEASERDEDNDLMDESEMRETEQYLNELETQLQQARTDLLGAKLQLSDNQVEIQSLRGKLEAQAENVNQFVNERQSLEDSFGNLKRQLEALHTEKIELSQLLRHRE